MATRRANRREGARLTDVAVSQNEGRRERGTMADPYLSRQPSKWSWSHPSPHFSHFFQPGGMIELSPGSRSVSDEHPGDCGNQGTRPRQRVAEGAGVCGASGASCTPFRVRIQENVQPGVVGAISPRPRAIFGNPSGIFVRHSVSPSWSVLWRITGSLAITPIRV